MASPNTRRNVSKSYSDLYNTPSKALEKLFQVLEFDPNLKYFEPCNGKGAISDWVKENKGIEMDTNELFSEHGYSKFNEDFLNPNTEVSKDWNYDVIITNPPYKIGTEFVLEGFKYAKDQYHLLRVQFLEGDHRYESLLSLGHLEKVYCFYKRISCSKGVDEEPTANANFYCWFHFNKDFKGSPTIQWI